MRQIIKNELIQYKVLNVEDDMSILEYLMNDCFYNFVLQKIQPDTFGKMVKNPNDFQFLEHEHFIAGYNPNSKGDSLRNSGGLKLSDDEERIFGSFVVLPDKVIYNPHGTFFHKERDAFVYFGTYYYTTMGMIDIFVEVLDGKELLVDLGEKAGNLSYIPILEKISKEEMIEYATDPSKGKKALQKRRSY